MAINNKMPVQTFGRVLYVEPNDVSGAINGVPLTPDYTDMCISFNLICQVKSRIQNDMPIGETSVKLKNNKNEREKAAIYQIFGVTGKGETRSWVSFLQGEAYKNTNSLTTYYVDINYDDYLKNNIVEGLGVENISISYESYYTPNVTIKFVDHRGASLFGREEATHYNDKITIDNIFGAFFTAPYPEYILQVKGFYGKPITYRLCCTGFKGALNSNTGNFEAVATFVGYSYSLLTDIPFEYLVAAPYCKYVGEDYWKSHRGSEDWRLEGNMEGDDVPTLYELLQRINAAFYDEKLLQVISDEEQAILDEGVQEKTIIEDIKIIYESYVNQLKSRCINFISDSEKYNMATAHGNGEFIKPYDAENEQLLLMKSDNSDNDWSSIKSTFDDLRTAIKSFNETFKNDAISEDMLPVELPFSQMSFTDYFLIDDNKNVRINKIEELTVEKIKQLKINGVEPSEVIATKIFNAISDKDGANQLKKYVYLVDLGWFSKWIENKISELSTLINEINRKSERNYLYLAIENLGIVPYMGNIFKLVMCHIETFVQIMKQCFVNINRAKESGLRHPSYLGVNIKNTDFVANNSNEIFLPPWPAVNKKDDGGSEYADIEKNNTFGWVGDFSDNFEEAKVVRALYAACKRTSADPSKLDGEEKIEFLYAPILPNDLNNSRNPFDRGENRGEKVLSSLGGMLGIRMAQIFGVGEGKKVSDTLAKTLGKVDALNYYRFIGDKTVLEEDVLSKTDNLADTLYDIMLCKESANKHCTESIEGTNIQLHDFEFTDHLFNDIPDRQPIYVESNNILSYTYMPNKKGYGIVPSNTKYTSEYAKYIASNEDNTRHYMKVDYLKDETFLHYCTASQLFEDYSGIENSVKQYRNREMYSIISGTQHVSKILERYNQMQGGVVKVIDRAFKIDLKEVLDHYWDVDNNSRYKYMTNTNSFFSKSYKDCGIEDKFLLSGDFDKTSNVYDTLKKFRNMTMAKFTSSDKLKYDDGTEADPTNAFICGVKCAIGNNLHSFFGIDFYYMQNQIQDADTRNHVKALLFLHTLFYNKDLMLKWDTGKVNHSCISRIPFGLAALYGAFLWRHRYIQNNGIDPIVYGGRYKSAYINKKEYTLFEILSSGKWLFSPLLESSNIRYTYPVFGDGKTGNAMFIHYPDYMVINELINIFELFIRKQWVTISNLELKKSDGSIFNSGAEFREYVTGLTENYKEALSNQETDTPEYRVASAEAISNASKNFASFTKYYSFLWYYMINGTGESVIDRVDLWLNPANTEIQEALRSTYLGDCIELRSMSTALSVNANSKVGKYTDIQVYVDNAKAYINGFVEQLKDIVETKENVIISDAELGIVEDTPEFNRETALPIYIYLKMLWDKWLVSLDLDDNEFSVKNFTDNFIFIDSFYRNIASRFMVNCQLFLDCYNNNVSSNMDISVFKFLTDLTTKHNCMFVSVPDFISTWSARSDTEVRTSMETVFVPMPYNSMGKIRVNNKFVVMYIPKLSETPSEMNNFRADGFNIWSYNDPLVEKGDSTVRTKNSALPRILDSISKVDAEKMWEELDYGKYSYYVPAFGLAYGRQNNAIFKNLNLNMDSPTTTSVVINTLSHTARMGSNNTHRIAFVGQDLYPVYSNYAYLCEFEMMGCAQIQPLMYFQLMNVPMWRGTYIIYSVAHTMTPGNMVTKVKAMKMSNRAVPYSNAWFVKNPNFDPNELNKVLCLDNLIKGVNVGVISTPSSSEGQSSGGSSTNDNAGIIKGNHSGTKPVLCGDSWGVGLGNYFSGDRKAVGSSYVCGGSGYKSAVEQITEYLQTNPSPKFILLYSGINNGLTNAKNNCYEKFVKACNGRRVYLIQQQKTCHSAYCKQHNSHAPNIVNGLNENMRSLCGGNAGGKYKNAYFVNLNEGGFDTAHNNYSAMDCCVNDGCGCGQNGQPSGFHLKPEGYKNMMKTILQIIGETSYFKAK